MGDLWGSFKLLYGPSADESALLDGDAGAAGAVASNGYAVMSDWFFQMVFVATAASVVSGVIAERVKMWLFFGFNGGSQLALGSVFDAVAMSNVLVNTNLGAAAGAVAALAVSRSVLGRVDLFAGLNGAIAGLVSITAGPDITQQWWAVIIGAIGGVLCTLGIKALELAKIDDVVGAIPAHLICGIWGTLATAIAAGARLHLQLLGAVSVGAFVFIASFIVWKLMDPAMGLRVSRTVEQLGQDSGKLGIEAYPEFVLMPENFDE